MAIRDAKEREAESHPRVIQLKRLLRRYFPEMRKVRLFENSSTFTLNKSKIYVCVKDSTTQRPYDDNTMVYVILHELAHALNEDDIGHSDAYRRIFTRLLARAELYGLYDPTKKKRTDNFCVT